MNTTLLIMAAGIGSRFGTGIKQLEPVDDANHIIMDYSIHDAIEAGFNHVVFIIRKDIEKEFKEVIGELFFASLFWTKLQNIFGHCCMSKLDKIAKCWSALLSRPTIALQTLFNCYSTRYGNGRSVSVSSCACSLK